MSDALLGYFDDYNRKARIYPALVALLPLLIVGVGQFAIDLRRGLLMTVLSTAALFFIATVTRSFGKRAETKLLTDWGGWPTTILLRHRDNTIDSITKRRYHEELAKLHSGLQFPSVQQEEASPSDADEVYRSATKLLIEARRSSQYKILHSENASYGFRRNLFALKPVAVLLAIAIGTLVTGDWRFVGEPSKDVVPLLWFLAFDLFYILILVFVVTSTYVWQGGVEYAEALFRTLDGAESSAVTKNRRPKRSTSK